MLYYNKQNKYKVREGRLIVDTNKRTIKFIKYNLVLGPFKYFFSKHSKQYGLKDHRRYGELDKEKGMVLFSSWIHVNGGQKIL